MNKKPLFSMILRKKEITFGHMPEEITGFLQVALHQTDVG